MRVILCLLIFLVPGLSCFASGIHYPVSGIPSSLLVNADAVVRLDETRFEIKSLNHAVWTEHLVITIFKETASVQAVFRLFYDENTSVKSIDGAMYDAEGRLLRQFKSDDIIDHSAVSEAELYTNSRVKIIRPVSPSYPYTVEYYAEFSRRKILAYPAWTPRDEYRQSVQSSKLVIIADEGLFPRIKALNLPADIVITGDGVRERSWEIMDLKAMEHEPLSPGLLSVSPEIISAPAQYNAKGYTGDFSTWKGMGLWVESLYEGRDTLDFKYTCKLGAEVDAEPDTLRKIKMIYRYMQKTCRFVGVEIGIGGWQPVTANDVAHFGYGDCKGLANYTKALLKTFGIRSFCVLVQAGRNPVTIAEDFPSNGFNHVILAVPLNKDTVWLECTDMSQPFGYLGSFTDDRFVLLLAADGGIPARTPMYPKGVNTLRTHIDIVIDTSGNAEVVRKSTYKGLQYESVEEFLSMNAEHLKEKAKEIYNMPGLTLTSIQVASAGDFIPEAYETLKVSVKNYASLTGNRIFIPLNPFLDEPGLLNKDPERKNELVLRMPYIDYDTLVLHVPAGFTVESLPQSCNIKNQFGHMESELKAEGSTLKFYRKLEMEKGTYPAAAFNDFVAFLQQINRQDKAKVVLKH